LHRRKVGGAFGENREGAVWRGIGKRKGATSGDEPCGKLVREPMNSRSMEQLTKLEKALLEKLLNEKSETFQILFKQYLALQVVDREYTGVGFWTNFSSGWTVKLSASPSFWFGDVHAKIKGLEHGAAFELLVEDGCLRMLEGYSYDEPWSDDTNTFHLYYESGPERNEDAVIRSFTPAKALR